MDKSSVKPRIVVVNYSSRLLAESWESSNLYWALLADELALPPFELNRIVPELTRRSLERIFANDLEDWPALLRSLRLVGEDALQKSRKPVTAGAGF